MPLLHPKILHLRLTNVCDFIFTFPLSFLSCPSLFLFLHHSSFQDSSLEVDQCMWFPVFPSSPFLIPHYSLPWGWLTYAFYILFIFPRLLSSPSCANFHFSLFPFAVNLIKSIVLYKTIMLSKSLSPLPCMHGVFQGCVFFGILRPPPPPQKKEQLSDMYLLRIHFSLFVVRTWKRKLVPVWRVPVKKACDWYYVVVKREWNIVGTKIKKKTI